MNFSDKLIILMERLKIPHLGVNKSYGTEYRIKRMKRHVWDGWRLDVHDMPEDYIAHEIGHWIFCDPNNLRYPEYGLGTGKDDFSAVAKSIFPTKDQDYQEWCATIIGCGIIGGLEDDLEIIKYCCDHVNQPIEQLGNFTDWRLSIEQLDLDWMRNFARNAYNEEHG